jgi:hypothetical protein
VSYATLDALVVAAARLAPTCDPRALKAYITEYAATEEVSVYLLALAPPVDPLPAGTWRAGPIVGPGRQEGIALVIFCEPDHLTRLRGSMQ